MLQEAWPGSAETPLRLFWPKEPSLQETPCLGSEQPARRPVQPRPPGPLGPQKGAAVCLPFRPSGIGLLLLRPRHLWHLWWRGKGAGATLAGEGPPGHAGFHGGAGAVLEAGGSRAWWVMSHRVEPGDPRPGTSVCPCPNVLQKETPGRGVLPALPPSASSLPAPSSLVSAPRAPLAGPSAQRQAHTAAGPGLDRAAAFSVLSWAFSELPMGPRTRRVRPSGRGFLRVYRHSTF